MSGTMFFASAILWSPRAGITADRPKPVLQKETSMAIEPAPDMPQQLDPAQR